MPKTIEREIIVPPVKREGYVLIQNGFCKTRTDCKGLACEDCLYSEINLEAFVDYLDLGEIHGSITVIEFIKKETEH